MRAPRFFPLVWLCALSGYAGGEFFRDKAGDLKIDERAFECMDISSVKVSTGDRKTFAFEVKTRAPINLTSNEACYFIVAVNLDGDLGTGTSAWTTGQDFCAFIDVEGKTVKRVRSMRGDPPDLLNGAEIEGNTLRFTLAHDATKQKRMTFNIRSMVRRQSVDGKAPYSVLDSSVPDNERFNEFKF